MIEDRPLGHEHYLEEASNPAFRIGNYVLSSAYYRPAAHIYYRDISVSVGALRELQGRVEESVGISAPEGDESLWQLTTLHQRTRSTRAFIASLAVDPAFDGDNFAPWPCKKGEATKEAEGRPLSPLDEEQTAVLHDLLGAQEAFLNGETHPLIKGPLQLPPSPSS